MNSQRFDLIVLGLGPAGLLLAHRAHQRGLRVLGVDDKNQLTNTYGIFADELPTWLPPIKASHSQPFVITRRGQRRFQRRYLVFDSEDLLTKLSTFPKITGTGTATSPTTITVNGTTYTARKIVDCRGINPATSHYIQQAAGTFLQPPANPQPLNDTEQTAAALRAGESLWMDFSSPDADTFTYAVHTPKGLLVEHTLLAGPPMDQQQLQQETHSFINTHGLQNWPIVGEETVTIALDRPHPEHRLDCFGARAGAINPITGYSVGTSARMVDKFLDYVLCAKTKNPFTSWSWMLDEKLLNAGQKVLIHLLKTPGNTAIFFDTVLHLPEHILWPMLTQGRPGGTLVAMAKVFLRLDRRMKAHILAALLPLPGRT
ncbi:lycopene cyclase family protein [Corynebacterium aquilae]|uniref:Lycopene cyclase n=1 Tax=Corynebacterium aquilae DSM 44791 TaxID=1431546 RepID=A0A1L7CG22_9CORY|nr:lycopene cyclase family protein [Corynebacterium aquilae]APT84789.1 hypothetical protein CAQU_06595 [Corynebacterium aquilae DSM 44791]